MESDRDPQIERAARARVLGMFPGQGSQVVGMGKELMAQFPYTRLVFEEVEDAAKLPVRKLCFDGPEDQLRLTENTQPCILAVSVAVWRCLTQETPLKPVAFAGHSLGEYSALVAAGKLSLSRAAFLVRERGKAMQAAVPDGHGAMAAILMIPEASLADICKEAIDRAKKRPILAFGNKGGEPVLEIVNYNAPTQLVVAGHREAVEELLELVPSHKGKGVLLPVSAPFHSSLMRPARDKMVAMLETSEFRQNDALVIENTTGLAVHDYQWTTLADQIHSPVLWYQSLEQSVSSLGCRSFIEIGPGKVLFGLAKRQVPKDSWLAHSENTVDLVAQIIDKLG